MKKNYIARRRGTSVAAAALSFALVAPLAQPVAFAQETAAVADQAAGAPEASAPAEAYADAIYSPGNPENKGTISGSVKEIQEILAGFGNVQESGKALQGVKVFAQWYEGVNTEHASPVYYTESDENGNFSLNMAPYTDAEGVTRFFEADASVGLTTGDDQGQRDQKREKIRIWAELPEELADEYRLVHQPAAGVFPKLPTTPTTQGDATWGGNKITGATIQYAKKTDLPQHLPETKRVESQGDGLYGLYQGRAFWNLEVMQGMLNHNSVSQYNGKDVPAAGLQVVGSYLNDEAVAKIHAYAAENFAGKELRGGDWTIEDEQALQAWINEQVAADPEGWIAETVKTTTDANGEFKLYWRGLYGNNWTGEGGGINPDADKLHTLAASRDEGTFANGNKGSKHVNMDWSYVQVLDKDGNALPDNVGMLYPWSLGQWAGPRASGGRAELFGGEGTEPNRLDDKFLRWNVALYPAPLKFDVLEKNTYDNWARVGDKVETLTDGLPIGEGLEYVIEWTNDAGEVVETCGPVVPDADTSIPSCPLTVPGDVEHGDVFTARLYQGQDNTGTLLAQDTFAVTTSYLDYDPVDATVGKEAAAQPKFDNPETDPVEPKLESAEFVLDEDKLPEGVTKDQVKVDPESGVVTFTPKAGQEGKSFDIPVKMVDENIQVPVYDENGDPVVDEQGEPQTKPRTISHATATFDVATSAASIEPSYEPTPVTPGEDATSTPTFTDADGNDTTAPEGSKFTIPDDFTAPEGYKVDIDENTGEITVTAPEQPGAETAEEFEVPVTVTYPDGSTDDPKAKFELDTDGDGTPDSKDDDDDNDGFTDEEEKDAGTNPKDPSESPAKADVEDKTVVEGQPVDPVKVDATVPAEGSVEVTGLPEGLIYNPETGEITGTPTKLSDWGKDEETRDFPVKVEVKDKDGKVVATDDATWTVQRDTDGDGEPDVTDEDDDNDGFTDEQEKEAGTDPKDPNSKPETPVDPDASVVTDPVTVIEGQETDPFDTADNVPEGGKVEVDNLPGGLTVDPETGKVTGTPENLDDWGKDEEERDVTVTVTITDADGNEVAKEDKVITVQRDTDGDGIPDVTDEDDDNDGFTDEQEKEAGTDPKDPNSKPETPVDPDASVVTDPVTVIEGQETDPFDTADNVPEGGKVEVDNLPGGLTVDPETGKVTGTPENLDDWGKDEEERDVTVTVTITDADGNEVAKEDKVITVQRDTDGDGIPDVTDEDDDNDGFTDEEEKEAGTDPKDPNSKPSEGDGVQDTTPPTVNPITEGDKTISGTGDRPNEKIIVELPGGKKVETETDADGNWKIDVPADVELKPGDKVIVTDGAGNKSETTVEAGEVKDTTAPKVNPIKPGDKTISGTGDRPNEEIIVVLPGGKKVTTKTDDKGNWTVNVPSDVELKPGQDVVVADGDGNKTTEKVGIDTGKCVATSLGFGLPLLALIPLGLASQMDIPGLSDVVADANAQLQAANTQIQQQLGLFNPEIAAQVDAANQQLAQFGADLGTVAAGIALIAAGILAGTLIYDNCSPNGGSSVKDLELKGSSGKTYAGSSKKDEKATDNGSSSKDNQGSSEKK